MAPLLALWIAASIWAQLPGLAPARLNPLNTQEPGRLSRCDFPSDFQFGVSSSSFQYEGAVSEDGREPSIWDTFATKPGNIDDGSCPNITTDQYHRYEEDVGLIKNMGVDFYRFSISWSRVYNRGKINPKGIAYYNRLIDKLLENGIKPFVTLFHWDLPQAYEEFDGWVNRTMVDEYATYAEVCFQAFGDRVKHWLTFNEPRMFSKCGYYNGENAPGRCSACYKGNSATEPYIVGHHLLLSHAKAFHLYRVKYKAEQQGMIGISLDSFWFEPYSDSDDDVESSHRARDFEIGWFLHPLTFGDYPPRLREIVRERLPRFSPEIVRERLPRFSPAESRSIINSFDFLGLNHYTTRYTQNNPEAAASNNPGFDVDRHIQMKGDQNGTPIGESSGTWLLVVPWGFRRLLNYIKDNYNNPPIIVTENGYVDADTVTPLIDDVKRVNYFETYLTSLREALRDGVDVRAYFAWSLLDNWELQHGFRYRFGLHYVDFDTLKRYPKSSALWFKKFLSRGSKCEHSASI